jgi:uncharacterized protein (DUF3084 family)
VIAMRGMAAIARERADALFIAAEAFFASRPAISSPASKADARWIQTLVEPRPGGRAIARI